MLSPWPAHWVVVVVIVEVITFFEVVAAVEVETGDVLLLPLPQPDKPIETHTATRMHLGSKPAKPILHSKSQGAGESIINILQVCESDFATNLAKEESEEADAQSEYEKVSQENAVTRTTKEQSVKYKSQEATSQAKTEAEYTADRETANTELSAVNLYYGKIKDRCIARPETYSARKARREAEIMGLKEALSILEDETALVQRKQRGSAHGFLSM